MSKINNIKDLSNQVLEEMETDHLHVLIQDASVKGNYLIVINKAGREIRVPFDQVPALQRHVPFRDRLDFEIQHNGSCLYWKSGDIHLDFESLLYYVDDEFRAQCDKRKADSRREYGKAIAKVRTAYEIPINGITGLEPNEVQDIELGRIQARATSLCFYSEAIGVSLDEFLEKVAANVDIKKVREAIA